MSYREWITATKRELAEWPRTSATIEAAGKHEMLTLFFGTVSRKLFLPKSPSDGACGLANHISQMRRELSAMGAERNKRPRATKQRQRNRPVRSLLSLTPLAPVVPDPFAGLAKLKETTPMTRTVTIEGVTLTLETGKEPAVPSFGRPKGPLRLLLEEMKPGESVFLPSHLYDNTKSNTLTKVGELNGVQFCARTEGDGTRIYCTPRSDKKRSPVNSVQPDLAVTKPTGWNSARHAA